MNLIRGMSVFAWLFDSTELIGVELCDELLLRWKNAAKFEWRLFIHALTNVVIGLVLWLCKVLLFDVYGNSIALTLYIFDWINDDECEMRLFINVP